MPIGVIYENKPLGNPGMREALGIIEVVPEVRLLETISKREFYAPAKIVVGIQIAGKALELAHKQGKHQRRKGERPQGVDFYNGSINQTIFVQGGDSSITNFWKRQIKPPDQWNEDAPQEETKCEFIWFVDMRKDSPRI